MFGFTVISKKRLSILYSEVVRLHKELWIANYRLRNEMELNEAASEECKKAEKKLSAVTARLSSVVNA